MKLALCIGNRGFFPVSLIKTAREEIQKRLAVLGIESLCMPIATTHYGAVETSADGQLFAAFLAQHREEYDGVILVLPNFGDENGVAVALRDCGTPIYILAFPDEIDKMDLEHRRDAFCGKIAIMNVFRQYGIKYTAWMPHVLHPASSVFDEHIQRFAAVCRIVNGMRRFRIGALGARTTAFKSVRFDELTLQRYGITTETLDLSEIISRTKQVDTASAPYQAKAKRLQNYTNWNGVPDNSFSNLVKLSVVIDEIITEYQLNALALRCWLELEKSLKISPCVLISELNDRGIPTACELDVCNTISMYALQLAAGKPAACLDWNNNYGDDENKCILFHCGSTAQSLMTAKGQVVDHPMFAKTLGAGCGFGCNVGRIAAGSFTFTSSITVDGRLKFYLGEGEFTNEQIPDDFFGCAGVARIDELQEKLNKIGHAGYRHHVAVAPGQIRMAVKEAFTHYLNYEIMEF